MNTNHLQLAIEKGFADLRLELDARFNQIDDRFDQVDERFDQVDERFNQVDDYARHTRVLMEALEGKVDLINEGSDGSLPKRVSTLEVRVAKLERKQK